MLNLQLKILLESEPETLNTTQQQQEESAKKQQSNHQIKLIRLKLEINSEEEAVQKRLLQTLKQSLTQIRPDSGVLEAASEFGDEFITELKLVYKVDLNDYLKTEFAASEAANLGDFDAVEKDDDDDDDDESNFFDAYEDTESIREAEAKARNIELEKINEVKKKILAIGSKKSALRLSLVKAIKSILKQLTDL
jgi:hypothetical protein